MVIDHKSACQRALKGLKGAFVGQPNAPYVEGLARA